jgi:MFS family permease
MLGSTYFTTFLTLKLHQMAVSEGLIGLVHAAFSIGFVIGTLKAEPVIEKIGHRNSFVFFSLLIGASIFLNQYFTSLSGWIFLRLVSGICLAALYVIIESLYLLVSPLEKRGQVLSIYMIALYLSQSASQFFYNLIPLNSDTIFWILALLITVAVLPMARVKNPIVEKESMKIKQVIKQQGLSKLGLHASFASGVILTSLYSFLPLLAKKLDLSVSLAMSALILGGLTFQWPIGYLADRFNKKKVLFIISCFCIIPCLLPLIFYQNPIFNYACVILIGGLSFSFYPLAISAVCENKPKEELTALTGLVMLLYSAGMVFGPIFTPLFNLLGGVYGLFIQVVLFCVIIGIHTFYSLVKKQPVES